MQKNIKWPSKYKIKPDEEGNQIAWLILSAVKKLRVGRNKLASFLKGSRSKIVAPISGEQIYGGLCWVDIATIQDIIEQLERMGFIQRKAIEDNSFYSILELTEAGKKALDEKIKIPIQMIKIVRQAGIGLSEKTTYELFKQGKTIADIAKERKLAESTIYTHLYRLIVNDYISSSEVVSKDTLKRISDTTAKVDCLPSVKEIKEILPDISYDEIRCGLAGIRKENDTKQDNPPIEHRDVVDNNDKVLYAAPKNEIYEKNLPHRIAHVLVFNSKGEMYLQKRAKNIKFMPGCWCTAAGGHVTAGESYEEAAKRELDEEINVSKSLGELKEVLYFCYTGAPMKKFMKIYSCVHDGKIEFNREACEDGRFFSKEELKELIAKNELVHPELKKILGELKI